MKRTLFALLVGAPAFASEVRKLQALFDRTWEARLNDAPLFATSVTTRVWRPPPGAHVLKANVIRMDRTCARVNRAQSQRPCACEKCWRDHLSDI